MKTKVLIATFLIVVIFPIGNVESSDTTNNNLISVTKQVIRAAAKFGIEEAGTRIMGSAWAPFKAMLSPVFGELGRRYPKFFLLDVPPGNTPTVDAQLAAKQAVSNIESDHVLQQLIVDGFNKLDQGQYEIKNQIRNLAVRLEAINISIDNLSETSDKNFENVLVQLAAIHQKLDNRGESVGFSNQSVIFPLAFDLPSGSIEAYVALYIAGLDPIKLSVNKTRPYSTINVAVPGPGVYSYRLEHREITTLYKQVGDEFIPQLVPISSTNASQIEILPNAVYKLERITFMQLGNPAGNTIKMELSRILSPDEQAIQDKEAMDYLDQLIQSQ